MGSAIREEVYRLFDPDVNEEGLPYYTNWFIMGLIAANVVAVMLETVDPFAAQYGSVLRGFEVVSVLIFTIEYLGRIWTALEYNGYSGRIMGRLEFAVRPLLIIDLLAILPFYLGLVGVAAELRFLRALRLVRFLRLFKLARYSETLQSFSVVLKRKKPDFAIAIFANMMLLIVASSAMYYAEHQAQPEAFSSIPQTLWWGVITLTTVGYGDTFPVTPLGQVLGAITAIIGIGLFALPASILASGFQEAARYKTRECPNCHEELEINDLEEVDD